MSIKLKCECTGHPRPALEHNIDCPIKLGFYGGNPYWGIGKIGEKRIYHNRVFVYSTQSWQPTRENIEEYIREQRKEKLLKIEENGKKNI